MLQPKLGISLAKRGVLQTKLGVFQSKLGWWGRKGALEVPGGAQNTMRTEAMSREQRVMLRVFDELPPYLRDDTEDVLGTMCLAAARIVYEEHYIGPTEKQLDDIADAAAARITTNDSHLWKILDPVSGTVRWTSWYKVHQKSITRNTRGRKKLEHEMTLMREQLDDLTRLTHNTHDYATYVDEENCAIQKNFKELLIAFTAIDLRVKSLEKQYEETLSRLSIRRGSKAKDE